MMPAGEPALLSRAEARALNLIHYYTGRACHRGHIAARFTASGHCSACQTERCARWRRDYPVKALWASAKKRARNGNIPFTIVVEDIVIPEECPCCGTPLAISSGIRSRCSPSLDRMNPELGYVPGNINVICWRCNELKKDADPHELIRIALWMFRAKEHILH